MPEILLSSKQTMVEDALEFDKPLHASSKNTLPYPPHDLYNLPEERGYVRENDLGMVTSILGC
jgi:hypothetical protein